jgi:hypothetical protein
MDILIIRLINLGSLFYSFLKTFGKVKGGDVHESGFSSPIFHHKFFKNVGKSYQA